MQRFIIQGELVDLNTYLNATRTNRYLSAKIKKQETEVCRLACIRLKKVDKVFVIFKWYCKSKRKDRDNIAYAKKYILDGMQLAGVIVNDGWDNIIDYKDVFIIDKIKPRIEVEIYTNKEDYIEQVNKGLK